MQRIVVLGAGFAGLWAAAGAARARAEHGLGGERIEIAVLNATPCHSIRVRNYEADLSGTLVALADVLEPIDVRLIVADVTGIDPGARSVAFRQDGAARTIGYDRLVVALGSHVRRPAIPGLAEHAFDVDTFNAAMRLAAHLAALRGQPPTPSRGTALVVGGGLTGIETAAELPTRLRAATGGAARVILCDRAPWIGSDMGESARPVIAEALGALGVECRAGVDVAAIDSDGVTLRGGERIAAATVVWCAGIEADALTACFPVVRDALGRLPGATHEIDCVITC